MVPKTETPSGHVLLYGRSAVENDAICKGAKNDDLWFHVTGLPGSHCLIVIDENSPPVTREDRIFAATIAKQRSKAKNIHKASVEYCLFSNIDIDWDNPRRKAGEVFIRHKANKMTI